MLVLNYGSSRIKFAWFDATIAPLPRQPCWHGKVEGITGPAPRYQEAGQRAVTLALDAGDPYAAALMHIRDRSEEHTSELQSLMRISYAVFCLKKKKKNQKTNEQYDNRLQVTSPYSIISA